MIYLFIAYGVAWLLLFGYMGWVSGRQRDLEAQVKALREYVDRVS